jgi:hypothetical protein
MESDLCPSPDHLRTSSGRPRESSGLQPGAGVRSYHREDVQDAGRTRPQESGCWVVEEVGRPVLPADGEALSYRAIPPVNAESGYREMQVESIQGENTGVSVEELPATGAAAGHPVGGG